MPSLRYLLAALGSGALLVGCDEFTAPGIEGRWAAPGIEVTAHPRSAELRFRCTAAARLTRGLLPDSGGRIRFSVLVQPLCGGRERLDFAGRLVADTLFATVTRTFGAATPVIQTYTMLPQGDADFVRCGCAY